MNRVEQTDIDILGFDSALLEEFFQREFGRSRYHSRALFRHLYRYGSTAVIDIEEFSASPGLARQISERFPLCLPDIVNSQEDNGTQKITMKFGDENMVESVIIPMPDWETLCVSSQLGCSRACVFCETSLMGLTRNLKPEEIVAQWAVARFTLKRNPRNVVFMGMGEPFDNFDPVIRAIDIFSDPRGINIPKRRISISTSGHAPGIRRLSELDSLHPEKAYRCLHLALSLNSANDKIRSRMMPINNIWPLGELKDALLESPQSRMKDGLYFEYVLIPGLNDSQADANAVLEWMDGLEGKINLIPYHPRSDSPWSAPNAASLEAFHKLLKDGGRTCRIRTSRGSQISAACGMLANRCETKLSF